MNKQTESKPPQLNEEIRVKIVTDMVELIRKGHKYPVVELYNDVIDVWIPITELSFSRIQDEIAHIEKVTEWRKTGCYVDSEALAEARNELERNAAVMEMDMVSEKKCTFCHKTIPDGEEIYLDEGGSDGMFCDNDVCADAYICKCVEKVARE